MIGKFLTIFRIKIAVLILISLLSSTSAFTQALDSAMRDAIKILTRHNNDSVSIRWAPLKSEHWILGNKFGYKIERFTLVRSGRILPTPEHKVLTPLPVKPFTETKWEKIVQGNKYAAIAAQALLGETFELDMQNSDVVEVVNKAKENNQRYSIALYCADMSPPVATALGLYFTDRDVSEQESYLYKISSAGPDSLSVFGRYYLRMEDAYSLPAPSDFSGKAEGNIVNLKWNQQDHIGIYTTYQVERSVQGSIFTPIADDPTLVLSNNGDDLRYQYATDTLKEMGVEHVYRVRGISPFGELGPPSEPLKIKGSQNASTPPVITSVVSRDNKSASIEWMFPEHEQTIDGFLVERAESVAGAYKTINTHPIPMTQRSFFDESANIVNYYRVSSISKDGQVVRSMPYFFHLIDSIAPDAPVNLKGKIDEVGNVTLTWDKGTEPDLYGYRVFKTYYLSDEFAQLTFEPISDCVFKDQVELKSLNEKVHFTVVAVDRNQNQSKLSSILSLALPDKVPPVAPVFLPVRSENEGITLRWFRSASSDVAYYDVYRQAGPAEWVRLAQVKESGDSVHQYVDSRAPEGILQTYTIVAIDDSGLESSPSIPVNGAKLKNNLKPPVVLAQPIVDRSSGKVSLKWSYEQKVVHAFRIYRTAGEESPRLYKTTKDTQFSDQMLEPGITYKYQVIAVFNDGTQSSFSNSVEIRF
jgi:uncharacterized protein